jgi:hypothetical protein
VKTKMYPTAPKKSKICRACEQEFMPRSGGMIYCREDECVTDREKARVAAVKKAAKERKAEKAGEPMKFRCCNGCGKAFTAKEDERTCSRPCHYIQMEARNVLRRSGRYTIMCCGRCGARFTPTNGSQIYCRNHRG